VALDKMNTLIYSPETLSQALLLAKANPDATILGGGSHIPQNSDGSLILKRVAISLHKVRELKKIQANERGLEFGSSVTLGELIDLKSSRVPELLREVLGQFASWPMKNIITLGGNLCMQPKPGDLFLPIFLLGSAVEIRSANSSVWLNSDRIWEAGGIPIKKEEILTRVRVPSDIWNFFRYSSIGKWNTETNRGMRFAALASASKEALGIIRVGVILENGNLIRDLAAEESLAGQNFPLKDKDIQYLVSRLIIQSQKYETADPERRKEKIRTFVYRTFKDLSESVMNPYF